MIRDRSLRGGRAGFLAQRLAHHGILAGHSPAQSAFHLGSKSQLIEVVGLFSRRDKALGLKGLVLKALQTIAEVGNVGHSGIAAGKATGCAIGSSHRGAAADGRESLGGTVLEWSQLEACV